MLIFLKECLLNYGTFCFTEDRTTTIFPVPHALLKHILNFSLVKGGSPCSFILNPAGLMTAMISKPVILEMIILETQTPRCKEAQAATQRDYMDYSVPSQMCESSGSLDDSSPSC